MKEMINTMLFFDNCFLENTDAIKRVWHQPEFKAESDMSEKPVNQWGAAYPHVIYDSEKSIYRCWYSGTDGVDEKYQAWYLHYAESIDGWRFKPVSIGLEKLNPASAIAKFSGRIESMVYSENYLFGADITVDPYEDDCGKKFKLCYVKGEMPLSANWFCGIAYSPDGFNWTTDWENPWFPLSPESVSDTVHLIRYNPLTGKYQIICRPAHGDRRVAIVESENGINWTKPRLILGPDGQDPDAMQFYAMPAFYYNGIWIGLLWEMRTDPGLRGKAQGPIDVHITYSYNG
ncbi:MAG: hypothetical protein FIA99_02280, partial [Ruminiclostridium sp.]|nr:hypothetical protein [Ruminiclostridium sp.]